MTSVASQASPPSAASVGAGALGAVWSRMLDRVEHQLRPSERIAEQLLQGAVDASDRKAALESLDEAGAWLADIGIVAGARGARALREHIEEIPSETRRDVGRAVVLAALIEGVRSSVETVGSTGTITPSLGDRLLVIGEPSLLVDNVLWLAASGGFSVHHAVGLEHWPDAIDAIVIVDRGVASSTVALLACRSANEIYGDQPLIVVTDRVSPKQRAELAQFATSLISAEVRTIEVVDEVRRHLHALRRPKEIAIRGTEGDRHVPALVAQGIDAWSAANDRELMAGLEAGRAIAVLLLPSENNAALIRLLRCQPSTRRLTIVEVLEEGVDVATTAGVDATIESEDAIGRRAGQLAELLRLHADLDLDVSAYRRSGGVPWASAAFLAERVLLAAHRTDSVATVCVIRYGDNEDVAMIDAVQDALMREFRTDDIVTRNGDRENILVLGSVGAEVAQARLLGIVERSSTAGSRVGIAEFPHDEQSLEDLIGAARSAIERAHAADGPRVVPADWRADRLPSADVIVADSDSATAHVIGRALDRVDLTVEYAADGDALMDRLRDPDRQTPKLLILDFDLLGIDGLTVLRRLGERAALRRIRVVMLAAQTRESEVRQAYDHGVVDVIDKPFSPGILARRILRAMEDTP